MFPIEAGAMICTLPLPDVALKPATVHAPVIAAVQALMALAMLVAIVDVFVVDAVAAFMICAPLTVMPVILVEAVPEPTVVLGVLADTAAVMTVPGMRAV
jgi:hypothetical protein